MNLSDKRMISKLEKKLAIGTPSDEQQIKPEWLHIDSYQLFIKRDDQIHPQISGNKWRKLKYQLLAILSENKNTSDRHIISFGGGYSNHIHALAYCCYKLGIKLTAIIRGDYSHSLTPMLTDIKHLGCDIKFVTKKQYSQRNDSDYLHTLKQQFPKAAIIPEGGSHEMALCGINELVSEFSNSYDVIVCPVASAGTFAGLIRSCPDKMALHGIAMLKGQGYLENETQRLFPDAINASNWTIHHDFHCGGYAKKTLALSNFCDAFTTQTTIPIEPIYSGKMLYAVKQLIEKQYFPLGSKILTIHTGGLQGNRKIESHNPTNFNSC
jgi:1-aminocyclopropane-1-carboxylate deaminase